MNLSKFYLWIFASCISIALSAQNNRVRIPDSLLFTGMHFSLHGLFGYAQPAIVKAISEPHKPGTTLSMHVNYGFAFSFYKPGRRYHYKIGLDVVDWFENYNYDLKKSPGNNLFYDIQGRENFYILESYYLFVETGYRFNLTHRFFISPFFGTGIDRTMLLIGTSDGSHSDSLGNSRLILHIEQNNLETSRIRFRVHAGLEMAKILPWQHIVSLRFIASYSPGTFANGNYTMLPGTSEQSTGTYDLKGNYFGLELAYTFTGIRRKRLQFN
ncbi:hypothetical protein BH11BAC7_BH11BAC7_17770 [soil metagenome]